MKSLKNSPRERNEQAKDRAVGSGVTGTIIVVPLFMNNTIFYPSIVIILDTFCASFVHSTILQYLYAYRIAGNVSGL